MDLADVDGRGGGTEKRSLVGNRVGGGGRREESVLSSSRRRMRAGFDGRLEKPPWFPSIHRDRF